ncbi:MAG: acyl-CoA dehydrogenase family protein [Actinomycetota bacterium]|nr:acyl-CoA dehydrogenase family protein [Actinomycetota bacterium]
MSFDEGLRAELRTWLAGHWDPGRSLVEWRQLLVDGRWAVPAWPKEWFGRGLTEAEASFVKEELRSAGAIGPPLGVGTALAGPTILAHGSDQARSRFLRYLLTGEEKWCQLFSEPGAGSDLAGLTTTAVIDGSEWIVNGQKLWSTSAHHADIGLLLARTNWDVPKHRGITCFAIPMRQPGIEVRPIAQMNGYRSFNEIFITDARIPAENVIGDIDGGWAVALTTLAYERRASGLQKPEYEGSGRAVEEARREADDYFDTYRWYPQRAGRVDLALERGRTSGSTADPIVRQALAGLLSLQWAMDWTARRARAAQARGQAPGAEGSIAKLGASRIAVEAARVHTLIAGADAMLASPDGHLDGIAAEILLSVPAQSIAGGTDEIQRNILGEQVLGLPREPPVGKDLPFRSVHKS